MSRRVSASASATATAGGAATVFLPGPFRTGTVWDISTVVIESTKPANGYPLASIYRGSVSASNLLGQSRSADKVTFEGAPGDRLLPGDQLVVVMSNVAAAGRVTVNMFALEVET